LSTLKILVEKLYGSAFALAKSFFHKDDRSGLSSSYSKLRLII
jgi:hypothetical protein